MLLICPQCFHAVPEPLRTVGFRCDACRHRWEPLDPQFSRAYYGKLSEMEVSLRTDDGNRLLLTELPAVVGRDSEFSFLQNNLAVSRRHCEVGFDASTNAFFVRDLGSSGGSYVEQQAVPASQSLPIQPGQSLRLAGVALRLDVRLRRDFSSTASVESGASSLPLGDRSERVLLAVAPDGTVSAAAHHQPEAVPLAVLQYSKTNETWRILAISRQKARVNGEIFIERELQPFDQLTLNDRSYVYDQLAEALGPETVQAGPTIELRSVNVTIRGTAILNGVDCRIPGGRMSAVIGQSGSGKTTLLKILSGTMLPDSGNIFINGQEMSWAQYGDWARSHLALVPQADVIHGELTVLECLEYAASLLLGFFTSSAEKRDRIQKLLRELGLEEHQHKRIDKLSGGQRKRVNVAVELFAAPSLLLLDEPTTSLDYFNEHELVSRLQKLSRQGRTIVFVTHSLASLELVDHIIFIRAEAQGGRIFVEGDAEAVRRRVQGGDWTRFYERPRAKRPPGRVADSSRSLLGSVAMRVPRLAALTLRYYRIWLSSFVTFAAFLVGLPLLLGLLIRLSVSTDGQIGTDRLLFGLIAAFWLGMNQSVREIVREKDIFLREQKRRVGCLSYLVSKLAFFGVIAAMQSVMLTLPLKWLGVEQFSLRFSLHELQCPWSWMIAIFWLSDVVGCIVGLFLSALCLFPRQKGEVMAVLLVILVTLPQFLFSAKALPGGLTDRPDHYHRFVLWQETAQMPELLSYATTTRYLFLPLDAVSRNVANLPRIVLFNLTMVAMFAATMIVLTWLVLEFYVRWNKRMA